MVHGLRTYTSRRQYSTTAKSRKSQEFDPCQRDASFLPRSADAGTYDNEMQLILRFLPPLGLPL